jgi:O-antigen ligase
VENVVNEPIDEDSEESMEEHGEHEVSFDAVLGYPMALVAVIPIVGLCFGDVAKFGGLTFTQAYLGITLASAAVLLVIETLLSRRVSGEGLSRLVWCIPLLAASLLGAVVVKMTRGEFSPQLTAWMLACQFALALWLFYLAYAKASRSLLGWLVPLLSILICLVFLGDWARQGMPYPFRGWAVHKNAMGVAIMCLGGLSASSITTTRLISMQNLLSVGSLVLCVPVLIICGARSSLMVLVLMIALAILFQMTQSTFVTRLVAFGIIIGSISFPIIYVNLQGTALGEELTGKSLDVTGQEIYNGRQRIWEILLDEFQDRPVFGHARQVAIERDNDIPMNAHNMLLATLYQGGLIASCSLLFLLGAFWKRTEMLALESGRWLPLAFFASILVRQMLESELTGENYTSMFAIWAAISLVQAQDRSE